ncbi:hypothetical protein DFH08DRAFT_867068 [Mycena albidolilacea]|uniref:Uncharacterized protein n=1 Tax=Mycena albidolilacea TaxID=1033008 RepID=A0AAD7A337_9AGAR|nr:hypothetical protein DFH08DRAFT_867068 [Mycena albidolilacea]
MQLRAPRVLALGLGLCVCFRCVRVPPRGVPPPRRAPRQLQVRARIRKARRRPSQPLPQEPDIIRHEKDAGRRGSVSFSLLHRALVRATTAKAARVPAPQAGTT